MTAITCNPLNGHAGPCGAPDCVLGGGPDMRGVNERDPEDCDRCLDISTDHCGFHQGFEHGYAAALRLMQEALGDTETVHAAFVRRDQLRKIHAQGRSGGTDV